MSSYQYRKSHCGDKTVVRSSYLHNGISYAGKMSSLYWIGALVHAQLATHSLNPCMIVPMQKWITHPKTDKMCIMIQSWIHSDPRYNQYFLIIIYFLFRIRPIWNSHLLYSLINLLDKCCLCAYENSIFIRLDSIFWLVDAEPFYNQFYF